MIPSQMCLGCIQQWKTDDLSMCWLSDSISTSFVARKFPAGEVQPSNATHLKVSASA